MASFLSHSEIVVIDNPLSLSWVGLALPETQVSPTCLVTVNIHSVKGYGDDIFLTWLYLTRGESATLIQSVA